MSEASTAVRPAARGDSVGALRLAVMANRMDAICREMTNTVLHSARSAVIGIARDFSCAIVTAARPAGQSGPIPRTRPRIRCSTTSAAASASLCPNR